MYTADPDPTKQLIGHAADDLHMYKNRYKFAQKLREALGDEFSKD